MILNFSELNPKRLTQEDGVAGWYPYYAGFSLRFACDLLREANLQQGALVADPWVGSGTTTLAAALGGFRAFGSDLNPFAVTIASARLISRHRARALCQVAAEIAESRDCPDLQAGDALRDWLSPSAARRTRALVGGILERFGVDTACRSLPPEPAFLLLCLVRGVRDVAALKIRTNPTWIKPGVNPQRSGRDIVVRFKHWVQHLADQAATSLPSDNCQLVVADARRLPLADGSAEAVLTSPPYCTRIDYAVTTRFELAVIGQTTDEFDHLRPRLMGTTTIRTPHQLSEATHWPQRLRMMLGSVRSHPSHRSEGYYFRNLLQYFSDADASLQELYRVLSKRGVAYLVLQSSYYKEIEIDLPSLFADLAAVHRFRAQILLRTPVRRVLTTINSRSRQYLEGRNYSEAIISLQK